MSDRSPLPKRLAAAVPRGVSFSCFHISTKPGPSSALLSPLPSQPDEPTTCESHFLAISSPEDQDAGKKPLLIFALEILIFTTSSLTFIFVSKADSSGFSSSLHSPKNAPSLISTVTSTFIDFLLQPRLSRSRVVLSLFARAQNQYLFPGSIENPTKHVLDDRQLIRWWNRIFDRTLRQYDRNLGPDLKITAHVVVPGCDQAETKAFFPPSSRSDPPADPKWFNSYPVDLLVADTAKPPRYLIPRLPDDPKSRFLDDLDKDFTDHHGQWRSVRSLRDFWEMMSYRQECSAGRLVGFIWMAFSRNQAEHLSLGALEEGCQTAVSANPQLITPDSSFRRQDSGVTQAQAPRDERVGLIAVPNSPAPSTPNAIPRHHSEKAQENGAIGPQPLNSAIGELPITESDVAETTRGEIVVDAEQYNILMDFLLQTDFAGERLAAEHSRGWISKALEVSKASAFGYSIHGELILGPTSQTGPENPASQPINVLTNIRKKRKADQLGTKGGAPADEQAPLLAPINNLATSLVRKKVKS
ncbi:uncharacterized protein A1O9_09026 [Exophiala aquamarina CBS 119918]|uniref:histone acetyltransferase n=1 Tax=Exophiala aquamarina CBS 119918 TaxID=1182545 RepID=A0A072P382_9EURO|nr:uncharacterized protein A1O9_09026 [Exophiala aquamarina CBS 119918]KEF54584.1 hypothetical protein A1O9_09026 [Exophiala aquamarina CBS 119918]